VRNLAPHPENETEPGLAILRVEGGLFFADADLVRDQFRFRRGVGDGAT
jgi:SulP family sulfate permease